MDEWKKSIQKMIRWIDDNICENPTLSDMSKQIGYSPYYCSTQFHAFSGMTMREYVAQRKMYCAFIEVHNSDERLLDIAIKYGYQSHESLSRAFKSISGYTPSMYRKKIRKKCLPTNLLALLKNNNGEGAFNMIAKTDIRMEYIPAHKYLGVYGEKTTKQGKMWPGYDCELVTSIVQSMEDLADEIITAHTAGWAWKDGKRTYFYGLGVPLDYSGKIPEGFEIREFPGSYYIVFAHPPFVFPDDNSEVMQMVHDLAWNFDPATRGYEWNEDDCQDYQCHYPEGLGYQVLRPVRKI